MGEDSPVTIKSESRFKKLLHAYKLEAGMTVILIVLYLVLHLVTGTALKKGNLLNVLQSSAPLLIMTMGQLVVVITGGIDLSVGSIVGLSTVMMASLMSNAGLSFPVALLATLLKWREEQLRLYALLGLCLGSALYLAGPGSLIRAICRRIKNSRAMQEKPGEKAN